VYEVKTVLKGNFAVKVILANGEKVEFFTNEITTSKTGIKAGCVVWYSNGKGVAQGVYIRGENIKELNIESASVSFDELYRKVFDELYGKNVKQLSGENIIL
jgi:hypothetical protein